MSLSQNETPIVDTLKFVANETKAVFYAPGHKKGQGTAHHISSLLGKSVFRADLPELPELDNLFAPVGVIAQAQALAADAFGASQTWFLVNGSTCGIIASILAVCNQGDKIILPRNIHQSAISGLVLSGAIPIFVNPEYNSEWDLALSITPESLKLTLQQHPDGKAVLFLYPTYQGVCGDIQAIASLTHDYNIPLIVDEAHGAHFAFHPELPISALAAGADIAIQSTHKVLSAMTQASMLHLQGNRIDPQRLHQALQLVQSTSPSYLLLASLDAARHQIALEGKELLTHTLELARHARNSLSQITGLSILEFSMGLGIKAMDLTRLTVKVNQLGLTGFQADEILHQQLGVTAELPLLKHLTFIISLGNTQLDIEKLIEAFETLRRDYSQTNSDAFPLVYPSISPPILAISPREAFFSKTKLVSAQEAINNISAEIICPYPPGIPVLMPGEIITQQAIDYLSLVMAQGGKIIGCRDATLTTWKIVDCS